MKNKNKVRVTDISTSDRMMDVLDGNQLLDTPVNQYPIKCKTCSFPDINRVPEPYYLSKRRIFTGIEIITADLGNLLVSPRVKAIIELLLPGTCTFYKTFVKETKKKTDWYLAVPKHMALTGEVKDKVKRCSKCGEPLYAHPGSQYKYWTHEFDSFYDIVKSSNWHSIDEKDWKKSWIDRDVYLSVRFLKLLNKIKVKRIYQQQGSTAKPTSEDEKWIEASIARLGKLSRLKDAKPNKNDATYLKKRLGVSLLNKKKGEDFFKKHAVSFNEQVMVLLAVTKDITFRSGEDEITIRPPRFWEINKKKKLVAFAFNYYGDHWAFDMNKQGCPVFFYDHEVLFYEEQFSSIADFIKTLKK